MGDSQEQQRTRVSRFLNKPPTFGGFAYDEVIPGFIAFTICMLLDQRILGLGIFVGWVMLLRKLKKSKGSSYLLCLMYWYSPRSIGSLFFPQTPTADKRFWLQ